MTEGTVYENDERDKEKENGVREMREERCNCREEEEKGENRTSYREVMDEGKREYDREENEERKA